MHSELIKKKKGGGVLKYRGTYPCCFNMGVPPPWTIYIYSYIFFNEINCAMFQKIDPKDFMRVKVVKIDTLPEVKSNIYSML